MKNESISQPGPKMSCEHAIELLRLFEAHGIRVWVDGGWAVDAVVGRETRLHDDLDIALSHDDLNALCLLLRDRGFVEVPRVDSWECNFVLGDSQGRQIDIHTFTLDENGKHSFGVAYPAESLTGRGILGGYECECIAPEWLLKFRSGYELRPKDYADIAVLCDSFGFPLPSNYPK